MFDALKLSSSSGDAQETCRKVLALLTKSIKDSGCTDAAAEPTPSK